MGTDRFTHWAAEEPFRVADKEIPIRRLSARDHEPSPSKERQRETTLQVPPPPNLPTSRVERSLNQRVRGWSPWWRIPTQALTRRRLAGKIGLLSSSDRSWRDRFRR